MASIEGEGKHLSVLHLAKRNVTRGICWKSPGRTDLHGGLRSGLLKAGCRFN